MIVNTLFTLLYSLIALPLSFIPEGGQLPTELTSSFSYFFGFLYSFDFIIPINTLLTTFAIAIGFQLALQTFEIVAWVLALIRGK